MFENVKEDQGTVYDEVDTPKRLLGPTGYGRKKWTKRHTTYTLESILLTQVIK